MMVHRVRAHPMELAADLVDRLAKLVFNTIQAQIVSTLLEVVLIAAVPAVQVDRVHELVLGVLEEGVHFARMVLQRVSHVVLGEPKAQLHAEVAYARNESSLVSHVVDVEVVHEMGRDPAGCVLGEVVAHPVQELDVLQLLFRKLLFILAEAR